MKFSVVKYSNIAKLFDFRIDSEYWHPEYIATENKIESHKWRYFNQIATIKGGKRLPLGDNFSNEGVYYIRAEDNKNGFVSFESSPKISYETYKKISNYQTNFNDVLITIVGNVGDVGIVKFNLDKCNLTENCAKIIFHDMHPEVGFIFLKSKYGKNQILREKVGTAQPKLALTRISKFKIPSFSASLQNIIRDLVKKSYMVIDDSMQIYREAQDLLLSELGLTNWQPKHQLTFIKNYSDTEQAERIDAEYYQPKYEEIIKAIKNYSGGWDTLNELVTLKNKNFNPTDKKQYQYIELSNIAGNGEVSSCMLEEGQYLPTRARRKVATGDVIVSSIEGSLSSIALIEKKYNQSLCSTGFHVANSKQFNSETLLVLLKSIVGQLQLKKGCNGTILTAINNEEFKKIILPKVDEAKQTQIQQKIAESLRLRQQSKRLLESAKKAVEIAIEQDEQTAIKQLKQVI